MGKKKLKLDFEHELESHVFGIATHLKDYRLIWFLNKDASYSFKRLEDLSFSSIPSLPEQFFSIFTYQSEVDHLDYFLINNKGESGAMFPALKTANFFLIINGFIPEDSKQEIIKNLRKVRNVLTVFEIDINKHKKVYNLIDQIEIHLIELKKKEDKSKSKRFNIKDLKFVKDDTNLPKN